MLNGMVGELKWLVGMLGAKCIAPAKMMHAGVVNFASLAFGVLQKMLATMREPCGGLSIVAYQLIDLGRLIYGLYIRVELPTVAYCSRY